MAEEDTVPELGLLNLRARKYGDPEDPDHPWRAVLDHLGVERLNPDEAVDRVVAGLDSEIADNGRSPRTALTALELLHAHDRVGLSQDHVRALADRAVEGEGGELADRIFGNDDLLSLGFAEFVSEVVSDPGFAPGIAASVKKAATVPSCNAITTPGGGKGATRIVGRFEMEGEVKDFARAVDPEHWPDCSPFFISMTALDGPDHFTPGQDQPDTGYTAVFEEIVGAAGVLEVKTDLSTRYFVGATSVGMDFELAPGYHGDGKVDVDHGYVLVEDHPTKEGWVMITSQKTLSFAGLDDYPFTFLCEFGWIDMMRAMAYCR